MLTTISIFIYLFNFALEKNPYTIQVYATIYIQEAGTPQQFTPIAVGRPLVKISDKLQTKKKIEKKKSSLAATRVGID
jgi:hypothetical protein